jgi:hypothetical protein
MLPTLEMIPAYYATTRGGQRIPFLISLLLYDTHNLPRITPAVEKSIDRVIEITGISGVATAPIFDADRFDKTAFIYLNRAMKIDSVLVLFLSQSPKTAERLMQYLSKNFQLTLIQEN